MSDATSSSSRKERLIRKLGTLMVKGVYRHVEVYRPETDHVHGPQLSVSNHFGGFADPLLLVYAMPRLPRIIARDVIWKIPIVGSVMRWVGAIPVHKPEDGGPRSNEVMFASAYSALEAASHLMIFPEGITRDEPSIAPIKTGAARIALGARANGADGIQITPVGIHYEDKASLRSSVSVQVGRPIDLDLNVGNYVAPGSPADPENRPAVRALTDDIEVQLRRVAPDFTDWAEAGALTNGAEMLLRSLADDPAGAVPLAERDRIAGHLGRLPDPQKSEVVESVAAYDRKLSNLGLTDAEYLSEMTGRRFLRRLIGSLILAIVLLPYALVGVSINWIPYLIVKAVGLLRVAPAVLATIKPMTAIVVFGVTWGITVWAAFRQYEIQGAALAILVIPVYLVALIVFVERFSVVWSGFRAWRGTRALRGSEQTIADQRRRVIDELVEVL